MTDSGDVSYLVMMMVGMSIMLLMILMLKLLAHSHILISLMPSSVHEHTVRV